MVVFSCDNCGDTVKKPQVEKHRFRCGHQTMFCCIDCQKPFYGDEYKAHTKCVSEAERYGGLNYVAKENKGEVKQDAWTEQVATAIQNCPQNDGGLKVFMKKLADYPNVPRKEKKFVNFCVNSISRDQSVIGRAWLLIVAAAPPKPAPVTKSAPKRPASDEGADDEETTTPKQVKVEEQEVKPIKWKKVLRAAIKAHEGENAMTKTELRRVVFGEVGATFKTDADFDVEFEEKLESTKGMVVETTVRLLR